MASNIRTQKKPHGPAWPFRWGTILTFLLSAGILTVAIGGILFDQHAIFLGRLSYCFTTPAIDNSLGIGKILAYSYLPLAPIFLMSLYYVPQSHDDATYTAAQVFRHAIRWITLGIEIGLLIYFYNGAKPYLEAIEAGEGVDQLTTFLAQLKQHYIWYTLPVFNCLITLFLTGIFFRFVRIWPVYLFFALLTLAIFMVGIPMLIYFIGGIYTVVIALALCALGLLLGTKCFKYTPPAPRQIRTSQGVMTEKKKGVWVDQNGNIWHSKDNGRTFHR